MMMYQLNPASVSYEEGRQYSESEIIWWAEDVASRLNQECQDITLLFDYDPHEYMDIYRAIEVLEKDNEFVEPVVL